ncbi:MAG: hypothetical protein JOS17DRAFT_793670 [Linnemannia elongata]|nr:MAG: hypothetical protein JOS17DRAFT_793670 [Linnemannia elongata]
MPDNVQDLQLNRLIIKGSLRSSDTSAPRPTVHISDPQLDPLTPHHIAASDYAFDTVPTSLQRGDMEMPPESSQEKEQLIQKQHRRYLDYPTGPDIAVDTPTSSEGDNTQQLQAPRESALNVSTDFTQTSINARLGDKDAQVALGDMYKNGKGVQQDCQAAMEWYLRAAEQGDPVGQRKVGVLNFYGQGVTRDYSTALAWYLKSANQGNAQAQSNIGSLYRDGQGVPQD